MDQESNTSCFFTWRRKIKYEGVLITLADFGGVVGECGGYHKRLYSNLACFAGAKEGSEVREIGNQAGELYKK